MPMDELLTNPRGRDMPGPLPGDDGFSQPARAEALEQATAMIAVIDSRALELECLTGGLQHASGTGFRFLSYPDIAAWQRAAGNHADVSVVLLGIGGKSAIDADVAHSVTALVHDFPDAPTLVVGDIEDPSQVVQILEYGARGYIPTSVSLGIAIEAIRLARAGGLYVPASSLISAQQRAAKEPAASPGSMNGLFTARQAAVADALRRGKANKIIAYELNLCESTVKVHIRNIMKKLKARNRTEVAFKISDLYPQNPYPQKMPH